MSTEITTMGKSDIVKALSATVRAFWSYSETVHLLPSEAARRRVLPCYLKSDLRDAARFGHLYGARSGGAIVGAAAWLPPQAYPISLSRQVAQVVDLLPGLPWALPATREALRGRGENRRHHRAFGPHFFLMAVGVDPDLQGEGIGTALLAPVLHLADNQDSPCFLFTASRANADWYQQLGFEVSSEYRPTPTWPTVWAMWRPVRGR